MPTPKVSRYKSCVPSFRPTIPAAASSRAGRRVATFLAVGCLWLTLLVTCLVWARGVLRVFAAGAAIPTACVFWFSERELLLGNWAMALLLSTMGLGVLSGEAAVIIYKWLERNDWQWPGNWPWPPFPRD